MEKKSSDINFNIVNYFFEQADFHPQKLAIVHNEKKITFSELKFEVLATSNYFLSKGIKKNDRVLIFVPMSTDLYRIVLALFNIGATAVFLDEWVSKKRLEMCCEVAKCQAFIGVFKARLLTLISKELRKIPIHLGVNYKKSYPQLEIDQTYPSDTALITFTTGSTGKPKAAKRTHGFLNEQFLALIDKIEPKENDVNLTTLPIVLLLNLGVGSSSVIIDFKVKKPYKLNCEKTIETIKNYKISKIIASPFFVKHLSQYLNLHPTQFDNLCKIYTGGAPVFQADAKLISENFKGVDLEIIYGSTEAEPISLITAKQLINESPDVSGLNVGFPYLKTKVKIIQISDNNITLNKAHELDEICLKENNIGEIIVSGHHVLSEYFNNDKALLRNKIFVEGICWHRTGDSGFLDSKGQLFLTGRCSSLIYKGEEIISPFVYENKLQNIDGIEIASVISIKNQIIFCIELKRNHMHQKIELEQEIKKLNLKFQQIIFLKQIPRDPRHHSKIDYEKLKLLLIQKHFT